MMRDARSQWADRVGRWRASGLTASEFAGREGLKASTLRWWSSTLKREVARPKFIEVRLPATVPGRVEVVVRDIAVRVSGDFDESVLRRVLAILESR